MEFIEEGKTPALIGNAELLQILSDRLESREKTKKRKPLFKFQHRDWIEGEVHRYLTSSPCVQLDMKRSDELKSKLRSPMRTTNQKGGKTGFGLTEAETLQILNFMPTQPVEIHLMIEKLPSRMSEEQQGELLEYVGSFAKKDENEHELNPDQDQEMEMEHRHHQEKGYEKDGDHMKMDWETKREKKRNGSEMVKKRNADVVIKSEQTEAYL